MDFPIIIQNDEIIFNVSPVRPNGIKTFHTLLSWLTDYGLIIPLEHESLMLKVGLIDGKLDLPDSTLIRALLIDVEGLIKEIRIMKDVGKSFITTVAVDYGHGAKYGRCIHSEIEMHLAALFTLNYSNDQILEYLDKNSLINNKSVVRYSLAELQEIIKDNCKDIKKYHSSIFE